MPQMIIYSSTLNAPAVKLNRRYKVKITITATISLDKLNSFAIYCELADFSIMESYMEQGTIISIVNNKGGTGKTATTCNIGFSLARLNQRVLVIDMDPQSNASSILLGKDRTPHSIGSLLNPDGSVPRLEECISVTKFPNLYIIPNISETAVIEPKLIRHAPGSLNLLRERIRDYALQNFDFTLIDNPPNLGTFVICSLITSDFVIVPCEAGSRHSLEGLVNAVDFINEIRQDNNIDLRFLKLLATKVNKRSSTCQAVMGQIKKFFPPDKIFDTYIPVNIDIQKAELALTPVWNIRSNSPGAQAYMDLAREIMTILGLPQEVKTSSHRKSKAAV
jgi:chromosome partitioning protein